MPYQVTALLSTRWKHFFRTHVCRFDCLTGPVACVLQSLTNSLEATVALLLMCLPCCQRGNPVDDEVELIVKRSSGLEVRPWKNYYSHLKALYLSIL